MRRFHFAFPILLAACSQGENAAFQGCKTMSSTPQIPVVATVDTTQIRRTASGLGIHDLLLGQGEEAEAGRTVAVHYTGWLTDGSEFDSSRRRGEVLVFALGQRQVIDGWDEGVSGMKVGGRRKLVIPPALGYGASGAGNVIPPNATLVFDVELCGVR
jgi:FKBP-type peptidyl-prolyl cis-trans isomerase FkpA